MSHELKAKAALVIASVCLSACLSPVPHDATNAPPLTPEITIPIALTLTAIPNVPPPTLDARELVYTFAPSPNGQWLAVVDDRGVQVHNTHSFEVLWRASLEGMSDDPMVNHFKIAWASDNAALNIVNSQSNYNTQPVQHVSYLSRFETQTGAMLWRHQLPDRPYISFAPNGRGFIAISPQWDQADLWDAVAQQITGRIDLPPHGVISFVQTANYSPDSALIAGKISLNYVTEQVFVPGVISKTGITEYDPALYIWDAKTGVQIAKLEHPDEMPALEPIFWSADGSRVVAPSRARILFWDAATWEFYSEIYHDPRFNYAYDVRLSPDGETLWAILRFITTSGPDNVLPSIGRWNVSSFQELSVDSRLLAALEANWGGEMIGWLPDGQALLLKLGSEIFLVDTQNGEIVTSYPIPEPEYQAWWQGLYGGRYFILSPNGVYLFALMPTSIVAYDPQTGEVLHQLED